MSGLDPLAAAAAQAIAGAQRAIDSVTIDLGVSSNVLAAQIRSGDLIEAVVLPPQNGSDRISLFGLTIAAQLPPGVHPGEALLLQVTEFSGTQIFVRNLGPVDPLRPPPPTIFAELPAAGARQPLTVPETARASQAAVPGAAPVPGAISLPREVFVAASFGAVDGEAALRTAVARLAHDLPARLRSAAGSAASDGSAASHRAALPAQSLDSDGRFLATPSVQTALLTRLRVPISSTTLVAARMIDDATHHVTTSYQRLEDVLSKFATSDPRVGSLRSLLAFTGKIDLRSARVLPEAIASFVSHVFEGAESKIAQIVRALSPAAAAAMLEVQFPPSPTGTPPQSEKSAVQPSETLPAQAAAAPGAAVAPDGLARAAERTVALEHDVKTVMLSLLHDPPRGMTPQVTQALSSALGATTALQLGALSAQHSDPTTIAIPLPAYFHDGGKPVQLRVSRDPGKSGKRMDADNFAVSFVLDTKTLGTVAIDLQTVGRAVSINVKTERAHAASRFRDTLAHLRSRLEDLRYRVASIGADVAKSSAADPSDRMTAPPSSVTANVDLHA
ncbi:MAG: flagellar hook-length control protein FliK [Candidatus Eremiobacteraeota bacterium]|nr:flagellar hook-length control protein FliK [Candidatus Eremiobacteraeota bacterium]